MPDINANSFADVSDLDISGQTFVSGIGYVDDTLKFSHAKRIRGENVKVRAVGAHENAVDCNRMCEDIRLSLDIEGGKQCGVVVKGGSKAIELTFDRLVRDPDACYVKILGIKFHVDVSWDDFSDQSKDPSTGKLIDNRPPEQRKSAIWYAYGRRKRPATEGNVRCHWPLTALMHFYNWNKDRRQRT